MKKQSAHCYVWQEQAKHGMSIFGTLYGAKALCGTVADPKKTLYTDKKAKRCGKCSKAIEQSQQERTDG